MTIANNSKRYLRGKQASSARAFRCQWIVAGILLGGFLPFSFCDKDRLLHSGMVSHERSNGLYLLDYIQKHWIMAEVDYLSLANYVSTDKHHVPSVSTAAQVGRRFFWLQQVQENVLPLPPSTGHGVRDVWRIICYSAEMALDRFCSLSLSSSCSPWKNSNMI